MANRKLGMTTDIRKSVLKNLTTDLIWHEKLETTEARAKEVKARRKIMTKVNKVKDENGNSIDLADKLFNVLGPRYEKRTGGYTQIIKLGQRRGDGAETVILKLV